ncbi:MAG TPA: DNA repair protein RecN [Eggerthellaceae bacterium]|nr:DNA repair protein RecN [Eggerthellaceae bacterium]
MIDEIQVHNLALIRQATLEPCDGLTAITGETGAGKTALLSALKLLMGARGSADMVRDGESQLVVSGRFFGRVGANGANDAGGADREDHAGGAGGADDAGHASHAGHAGGADDADELVVMRRVGADGRSRANLNGAMASMGELARAVAPSIDLCGQFEHQQLMRPATHVTMLDAWAASEEPGLAEALDAYRASLAAAREAAAELQRVHDAGELSSAKLDDARFTLRRIDEVAPREGEYEQLSHDLEIAEHAEALAQAAGAAREALSGESGAIDALNAAAGALETGGRFDAQLSDLAQSLREAGYILEDVSASVRDYRDGIDFDPAELAAQHERHAQLQGLMRAFGPRMEDVMAAREAAAETVSLVDDSALRMKRAQAALEQAESELARAADALDAARACAAPRFAAAVTEVMGRLEMRGVELVCAQERLDRAAWTNAGPSHVEFMYRPDAGMQARPLARIASGGEVSRVMLATKVVLGAHDDVDTLVFDEVDAGVGGAVAVALADVLADLARTHQVIVVTHLAQVAVRADSHYVVCRESGSEGAETALAPVSGDAREAEIARMLSGSATEASLAHARELLASAKQ